MIKHDVGGEMQRGVEKGEKAEGAPIAQKIDAERLPQGCYCKARQQKTQRPQTQSPLQRPDRLSAELVAQAKIKRPYGRNEADQIDKRVSERARMASKGA